MVIEINNPEHDWTSDSKKQRNFSPRVPRSFHHLTYCILFLYM